MVDNNRITEVQVDRALKKTNAVASSAATSSSSASIQINISNYTPPSKVDGRPRVKIPAGSANIQQQLTDVHTPSSSSSDSPIPPNVDHPDIRDILEELDTRMPYLDMLQYEKTLLDHGIRTVDHVRSAENATFAAIGMPAGVLDMFRDFRDDHSR
jgi:hypothetical protein